MGDRPLHRHDVRRKVTGGAPAAANTPTPTPANEVPLPGRIAGIRVQAPAQPGVGPLPAVLKSGIEALSGRALDDVRVHYNSDKPQAVQALAYTRGSDIYVAPGGEAQLPHEAWHLAQQGQARPA